LKETLNAFAATHRATDWIAVSIYPAKHHENPTSLNRQRNTKIFAKGHGKLDAPNMANTDTDEKTPMIGSYVYKPQRKPQWIN